MTTRLRPAALIVTAATFWVAAAATAQPLGTFTWQLQPYCNVVTVNLTQQGAIYTVDGFDDQCGAAQRAPLVGLATPNPDGTVGLGLNIVTVPGGRGVQVDARFSLPSGSGPWSDSAGNSGTFAFAAGTGGVPRPLPAAPTIVPGAIRLQPDGGVFAGGALGAGGIPTEGAGERMMWHPSKAAFRAGSAVNAEWDDVNVGFHSTAFGQGTTASGQGSTAMGLKTVATASGSTAAGHFSRATGINSTALGFNTSASGLHSAAVGSYASAAGAYSTSIGLLTAANGGNSLAVGTSTTADGQSSFVLGVRAAASATAHGSFVYGDRSTGSSGEVVTSVSPNQFLVRAAGGVVFWSSPSTVYPTSPGVQLNSNASAWSSLSDVNSKENFHDLADDDVLTRLSLMPVREWNYKAEGAGIRHIGPTAQDFRAAFGLGEDPLRISTIDADGVALAAVRALEARTRLLRQDGTAQRDEIAALRRENDELRAGLARLEALLEKTLRAR